MTRALVMAIALAAGARVAAADPDPRSPADVFGKPRAHGPAVGKAFIGLYSGRTDLFFGQPVAVELFAVPASPNGPYVHPHQTMLEAPTIDLTFACGARLKLTGAVDPELVAGIVKALKRA